MARSLQSSSVKGTAHIQAEWKGDEAPSESSAATLAGLQLMVIPRLIQLTNTFLNDAVTELLLTICAIS